MMLWLKFAMNLKRLDIEKAYDTMWREGVLIKLGKLGMNGKMYNYILDFLPQRSIRIKVGDAVSNEFIVENGIPQGSVISPILFNIMVNDMYDKLGENNEGLLYADDAVIWRRGRNIAYINVNRS